MAGIAWAAQFGVLSPCLGDAIADARGASTCPRRLATAAGLAG